MICVGDVPPDEDSWIYVQHTYGGEALDFPMIAFRKRKFSGRMDHISHVRLYFPLFPGLQTLEPFIVQSFCLQIIFLAPGEAIPSGYELLRSTVSGSGSGYLKPWGFFAFKRTTVNSEMYLVGDPMIIDITVIKRASKEEIPEKYTAIERDGGASNPYSTNDVIYAVQSITAMGLCNLAYEANLLDRYPLKDYKHLVLPEDALPAFMFPHGLRLELCELNEYPLPSFFTFVFTDQDGKHLYVACLKFYELVKKEDLMPTFQQLWGTEKVTSHTLVLSSRGF